MSATNHTTTIGLSQYISTDKPTYLTDYNGDMLAIDNAIASDRDDIATAQNKANTADGKADANKLSIDTIDAQLNGDPSDPSDTGLAGKVTDNSGDIDTIEALIGNGTPTTSNQTIIGAINGLEGAIAPREDGANLANSYAEGEQFARGGSVYTALTALTADTPFASLTLNTDYKNSDTLVEQIADAVGSIADKYLLLGQHEVSVTADGVKTYRTLINELHEATSNYTASTPESYKLQFGVFTIDGLMTPNNVSLLNGHNAISGAFRGSNLYQIVDGIGIAEVNIHASTSTFHSIELTATGNVYTDKTSLVPDDGTVFSVVVIEYEKV